MNGFDHQERGCLAPRAPVRASMRDELLALFSSPERLSAPPSIAPYFNAEPASGESVSTEVVPSGLEVVDMRLGGGFEPGLHLVAARGGVGKTAFLETVAWEAVCAKRPVLYYPLKEGSAATRGRLLSTLASIMGSSTIGLDALRDGELAAGDHAKLRSLERVLQTSVLTWLSLVDTIPQYVDMFEAFVEDVSLRSREIRREHGRLPVLLIDDSLHLVRLSRVRPLTDLLGRLDNVLTETETTGLISVTTPEKPAQGLDGLPVRTALTLTPVTGSPHDVIRYVDLRILTNKPAGWTGKIPLLLDRSSGMFAPRD